MKILPSQILNRYSLLTIVSYPEVARRIQRLTISGDVETDALVAHRRPGLVEPIGLLIAVGIRFLPIPRNMKHPRCVAGWGKPLSKVPHAHVALLIGGRTIPPDMVGPVVGDPQFAEYILGFRYSQLMLPP